MTLFEAVTKMLLPTQNNPRSLTLYLKGYRLTGVQSIKVGTGNDYITNIPEIFVKELDNASISFAMKAVLDARAHECDLKVEGFYENIKHDVTSVLPYCQKKMKLKNKQIIEEYA